MCPKTASQYCTQRDRPDEGVDLWTVIRKAVRPPDPLGGQKLASRAKHGQVIDEGGAGGSSVECQCSPTASRGPRLGIAALRLARAPWLRQPCSSASCTSFATTGMNFSTPAKFRWMASRIKRGL